MNVVYVAPVNNTAKSSEANGLRRDTLECENHTSLDILIIVTPPTNGVFKF
jgi:hypothetical protein